MFELLLQNSFWSVLDVLLIAVVIYQVLKQIKGTRTAQMLAGVFFVVLAFQVSALVPLSTFHWLVDKFYSSILVILTILFQDDIRSALRKLGHQSILNNTEMLESQNLLEELSQAAFSLASKKNGALLVIEQNIILARYIEIGLQLEASISKELLVSLYNPQSPTHDGAIIISKGKVASSGCLLPLTKKENLNPEMGTRHRAALGISEETDAAVILVSEELLKHPN